MTRRDSIGLLIAGNTRLPMLRRLARIEERLGPVRSTSYRLASRIANTLGAGTPVHEMKEFDKCAMVLISMPDPWLIPAIDELVDAPLRWKSKTVLLCGSKHDSGVLDKLAYLGAATGSVTPVPGLEDRMSIVEGNRKAVKEARRLMEQPGMKLVSMDAGRKPLFDAAVSFATGLALPLLTASVETLRSCGMSQNDAVLVSDRLFQQTLRAYSKAGRNGWEGPLSLEDQQSVRRQMQALFQLNPLLASYFFESAHHVVRLFRKDPAWVEALEPLARPYKAC